MTRCAAPFCRTTVTEWNCVQCRHGITTCDGCLSEEACPECGIAADEAGEAS